MRFLFLIHGDSEAEAALAPTSDARSSTSTSAYGAMLRERGVYVLGEALGARSRERS